MKINMIIISNKPEKLESLTASLHKLGSARDRISITLVAQYPVHENDDYLSHFNTVTIVPACDKDLPIPFVWYRKEAMYANPDCDYFWSLDDDHIFADGNSTYTKGCKEYYNEVFDWLEENPDVGVLSCKGYFGGYAWGYDFKKNPKNALVATDKGGIFFKNIGIESIINMDESRLVGALFESLATFNIMSWGFKLARRYCSPIKNTPPGKGKHISHSLNISYSNITVNRNVQKIIRQKFNDPEWEHSSKKYPAAIQQMMDNNGWVQE